MKYLQLFRWPNLAITALVFVAFRWGFLVPLQMNIALDTWEYLLLILSVLLIMAGGYVINDLQDLETDKANKPNRPLVTGAISEEVASNLFPLLFGLGIALGYFIGWRIDYTSFGIIHLIAVSLLWVYSNYYKGRPLMGNLLISVLAGITLLIIPIFDFFPTFTPQTWEIDRGFLFVFGGYAAFSFLVTFLREITKDLEDMKGDKIAGLKTTPIAWGEKVSKGLYSLLSVVALTGLFWFLIQSKDQTGVWIYVLLLLVAPLTYSNIALWRAKTPKDYGRVSGILKGVMVLGISSVVFFTYLVTSSFSQ